MLQLFVRLFLLVVCLAGGIFASVAKPTCGGSASTKVIALINPTNPPRECNYHINAYSKYVCQLRIDFAMTLAQPSLPGSDNNLEYATCDRDYFGVNGLRLCGVETSQHIYVPFNRTAGVTNVDLNIVLAARAGGYTGLPTPSWDITVTQLECPSGASVREADAPIESRSITDGFFVAPTGCLQYFPQSIGAFTSFNYNGGVGIYPGNLNYAICFRRTTQTEALELTSHFFHLGAEESRANGLNLDDYCYTHVGGSYKNEDYLMVPQGVIENDDIRATYFCGQSTRDISIRSTNPGPLLVLFNSDGLYKHSEAGFAFSYKVE